ncbi:hypothetical protein GCM10009733_079470 [Nonomuraea maheshkhaliensis]|uniref:Uncharacterized protein n=1 Tax=Nonomuraea maheshkhaliensis TaxID=419590 RepID=A0ABP4SD44_9ACTN
MGEAGAVVVSAWTGAGWLTHAVMVTAMAAVASSRTGFDLMFMGSSVSG